MQKTLTQYLLISLILSLGFGQLMRLDLFGLPIFVHDILVILLLVINWQSIRATNYKILATFLLGLSLGWVRALTIYPVSSLLVPALYSLRLLAYLALYQVTHNSKFIIPKSYFLIAALVSLCIGVFQYLFMPDMRIFQYLGWDDHLSRLTLPHFDPTFSGAMLAMFALLLPIQLRTTKYTIPMTVGILLTYSRSVWLSLFLTFIFFIKNKLTLIAICLLLFAGIFLLPKNFGEGNNLLRTYSITSRLSSDWNYVIKYKWDLLIGRGMNTLILDQPVGAYESHASGPNNSYLYLLTTTGVLGLVGWGIFLRSLYRSTSHKPIIVFVCIASLFNNVMFYPFALLLMLLTSLMVPTSP